MRAVCSVGRCRWLRGGAVSVSFFFLAGLWPGRAEPQGAAVSPPARPDLCLPGDPLGGEIVSPYGLEVPRECEEFLARTGAGWFIAWDRLLEAPRLVFPSAPFRLLAEGAVLTTETVQELVLAFLDEHREFFAVPPGGLSSPEVFRLDDGYLLSAYQLHEGLPVRGSSLRVRVGGDLTLRSVQCRLARRLPALRAHALTEAAAADLARAEGLELRAWTALQVAFPAGLESAEAAWAVAGAAGLGEGQVPDELELLYSAASGERLLGRSTALHFDCEGPLEVGGSLGGFSPPPDDIYSLPVDIDRGRPYMLAGVPVAVSAGDGACGAWDLVQSAEDGSFTALLERFQPETGFTLSFAVGYAPEERPLRFGIYGGLEDFRAFERRLLPAAGGTDIRLNEGFEEFDAFHLMTFHHLRRAEREVEELVAHHGLAYDTGGPLGLPVQVHLRKDFYEHRYLPSLQWMFLGSDEVMPRNAARRWQKIVPTILYHEWGHEVFRGLVNAGGEREIHEGIADAFAAYVARASTFGYVDPVTANADVAARDLKLELTVFPDEPRHTVAGALWELWEGTLDPPRPADPGERRRSSFAFGLLARWLASKRLPDERIGGLPVEFSPLLGVEFFLEADHERLGGNNDLRDGVYNQEEILRAFGRRDLFPHAFIRGDANGSAVVDLADPITVLSYLFLDGGARVTCPDALDADDSGRIEITDAIYLLRYLFLGGPRPAAPAFGCGFDISGGDRLGCWASPCRLFPARRARP